MSEWFHSDYIYRRRLLLAAPDEPTPAGHPVEMNLGYGLLMNGKVRDDFEDMEVVYVDEDGESQLIYREVEDIDGDMWIRFPLEGMVEPNESLLDRYYIYYGNLYLDNRPERPGFQFIDGGDPYVTGELGTLDGGDPSSVFGEEDQVDGGDPFTAAELKNVWPVTLNHDHNLIAYTRPGEHWIQGVSRHPLARATVQIFCTRVRVISQIGPDKGIMEVQMNDETEWRRIDLYSQEQQDAVAFEAYDLSPDRMHELRIRVGQETNPKSFGEEVNILSVQYSKSIVPSDLGEQVSDLVWSSSTGGGS